ncbi:hypothetical protein DPMN_114578 [Dreissena polymorpha]|uniref:Uncharacterized protein n=1 Tax=Dreissena polymorpha TaxID=45954 RepID=A0A9D4KL82_DREPO|nr:hypothetical protein DPMN_114578 [Dreissena polymorpha]
MGPCIDEINCIVIREVQYQFEVNRFRNEEIIVKGNFEWAWPIWVVGNGAYIVEIDLNRCRNEEIIVKDNFGWVWPIMGGAPQVEIDCIVIRDVQYRFEVNRCRNEEIKVKDNFGWAWPMWAGRPMINCIVIREVQYQFEVNRCRNEEIIHMWAGRPRVGNGAMQVQYQFEVNWCRNEEIIVKGNFGWAWPMWAGCPRIDLSVIREAQYQFEVNRCRNEEVNFQGSSAYSVGGAVGKDGRTDAHQYNFPTFSPKNVGIITVQTFAYRD